jgi:septal ring factor EnvC (AmiA/AmiB activator)
MSDKYDEVLRSVKRAWRKLATGALNAVDELTFAWVARADYDALNGKYRAALRKCDALTKERDDASNEAKVLCKQIQNVERAAADVRRERDAAIAAAKPANALNLRIKDLESQLRAAEAAQAFEALSNRQHRTPAEIFDFARKVALIAKGRYRVVLTQPELFAVTKDRPTGWMRVGSAMDPGVVLYELRANGSLVEFALAGEDVEDS